MKRGTSILLTILSAILLSAAIPNEYFHYGNALISIICLVPFFLALIFSSGKRFSAFLGLIFGITSSLLTYFWLLFFQSFSIWTITGTAAAHGIYFVLFAPIITAFSKTDKNYRPFILASVWVVYEAFKSFGYLGFPWGLMAHPAGTLLPLIQIAEITGIWGISFLFTLLNSLIAETIIEVFYKKRKFSLIKQWSFTGILFLSALMFGLIRMGIDIPVENTLNAVLVQQNTDSWVQGKEIESIQTGQILTRRALEQADIPIDLIIWNENSFRYPYEEDKQLYFEHPEGDPFVPFLKEINIPLLTGNPVFIDRVNFKVLNAAVLLSPDGKILQYYGKSHPVPFAENNPFWDIPIIQKFFKEVIGLNSPGWTVGDKSRMFSLSLMNGNTVKFAVPICFEDSFPELNRYFIKNGADLLINITNDAWSKTIAGETQHFVTSRYRAIENKRVLVRSTNAGVTCVIDPYGRLSNTLPLYTSDSVIAEIPIYKESSYTIYTLFGDYFPILLIFVLIGILIKKKTAGWPSIRS